MAGKTYIGNSRSKHIWVDNTRIKKIYVGTTQVFGGVLKFSYSGNCTLDGVAISPNTVTEVQNDDYVIRFLSSGTFTIIEGEGLIDVFCVGGGGYGSWWYHHWDSAYYGDGGGGGYTTNSTYTLSATSVNITIGAGSTAGGVRGGTTSFGSISANGGASEQQYGPDCDGGSGGAHGKYPFQVMNGGENGSNGNPGGSGQGTTTREFGDADGFIYSQGGGNNHTRRGENTGDGGWELGGQAGRSGIVCIRNHRS